MLFVWGGGVIISSYVILAGLGLTMEPDWLQTLSNPPIKASWCWSYRPMPSQLASHA